MSDLRRFAHRLLVAPRPAWPLAIARVILGLATLMWTATMALDAGDLLGTDSPVAPELVGGRFRWIQLDTTGAVRVALVVLAAASVAVIVGWYPSFWAVVSFVMLVAVQRRNTLLLNSGDLILRDLMLLLAVTPSAAAMSIDRVVRHGRGAFWSSSDVAPWGLRLIQLQMMVVYFFAFWSKSGDLWQNGTAVSTAFRLRDLQRFGQLDVVVDNVWIVAFLTWSTLAVELLLASLLWVKALRPYLIPLGVLLHLMIDSFVLVGFFGVAMIGGLMTFLDGERIDDAVVRWRGRRDGEASGSLPAPQPASTG